MPSRDFLGVSCFEWMYSGNPINLIFATMLGRCAHSDVRLTISKTKAFCCITGRLQGRMSKNQV